MGCNPFRKNNQRGSISNEVTGYAPCQTLGKARAAASEVINLQDNGSLVYELNKDYKNAFKSYFDNGNKESILEFRYKLPAPYHSLTEISHREEIGPIMAVVHVPLKKWLKNTS